MNRTYWLYAVLLAVPLSAGGADWRQFRGTDQTSIADNGAPPVKFDDKENVAWKVPLPGHGTSGPIVVAGQAIVTASSGAVLQDRLQVLSFDGETGKPRWKRQFWATGRCFHHPSMANATPTPASDGKRIFAFYSSNDLVCLDLEGNLLWYRGLAHDYPKAGNDVGMSSSPLVVGQTVVVQIENQGDSFAAGLDVATGETRWRIERPARANWASPAALRDPDGKELVLLQSAKGLTAHDPLSGKQIWQYDVECAGIPSATTVGDRIYLPAKGLTVLKAGAASTAAELLWDDNQLGPGNASPVIYKGKVFALSARDGMLSCGNAEKGGLLWKQRLKGTFWATPVMAGGHLYCVNQEGLCFVVKPSEGGGQLVHTADLHDSFLASPAVAGDAIFLRSDKFLYKIARNP